MENWVFIIEDIKNVCRICLEESKSMTNLFENNFQYQNCSLAEMINSCMLLKIEKDELLPDLICPHCETEVNQMFEFKSKYDKSHEFLQNQLTRIKSENFKENELFYVNRIKIEGHNTGDIVLEVSNDNIKIENELQIKENVINNEISDRALMIDSKDINKIPKHRCSKCGDSFKTKTKLRVHKQKLLHYIHRSVTCSKCKLTIPAANYKSHLLKHSVNLTCELCNKKFHSASNLRRHIYIHTKQTPYCCKICESKFSRQDKLKEHMEIHTSEKLFVCTGCDHEFKIDSDLKEHLEKFRACANAIENKHRRTFTCEVCTKSFVLFSSLKLHKLSHTNENGICMDCGKSYSDEKKLKDHWFRVHRVKAEKKIFLCYICAKEFKNKLGLIKHVHNHLGTSKKYFCNICNKSFTELGNLKIHDKVHTGEKPFMCHICSKAFNQPGNLRRHLKFHYNIRPYDCNICQKKFTLKNSLIVHMRSHTGEKPFLCSFCGRSFGDYRSLSKHFKCHISEIKSNNAE